jgi:hypothetical protein
VAAAALTGLIMFNFAISAIRRAGLAPARVWCASRNAACRIKEDPTGMDWTE